MNDPDDWHKALQEMGTGLMQIVEATKQIAEAAQGYRIHCEALGFSPGAAEAMAMDLYTILIHQGMTPDG